MFAQARALVYFCVSAFSAGAAGCSALGTFGIKVQLLYTVLVFGCMAVAVLMLRAAGGQPRRFYSVSGVLLDAIAVAAIIVAITHGRLLGLVIGAIALVSRPAVAWLIARDPAVYRIIHRDGEKFLG